MIYKSLDHREDNSEERINNLNAVDEEFRDWLNEMANYDVDEEAVEQNKKVIQTWSESLVALKVYSFGTGGQ